MTVTVRTMRSAVAMDVDISVWLHIEVFVTLVCGSACFPSLSGACAEQCSHDSDCPNDKKCCSNGCGRQSEPEKPGVCPNNNLAVAFLVKCVEFCSHDSDCPNDDKCC
uniref:WAP domain-containing protein n=1 Tax=Sinocyclocheilus rhinocerous TaxID=307959 RepID=A0A673MED4_9TELE